MFNKGIIKLTSLLLLIAVIGWVVPFQQVFHHHTDQVSSAGKYTSAVGAYEKSCCKISDLFHHGAAIIPQQQFSFYPVSYHYKKAAYTDALTASSHSLSNKAPPAA
jgi:hypothetical protein